jgi:hypothetical protein
MGFFVKILVLFIVFLFLWLVVTVAFVQTFVSYRSLIKKKSLDLSTDEEDVILYLRDNKSKIISHLICHGLVTLSSCWLLYKVCLELLEAI